MDDGFTIGEVARQSGMSVHALRYYEQQHLLPMAVARSASGHRRYSQDDIGWLEVCQQLRRSGMSIDMLREYTSLVRAGEGNEQDRLRVLQEHESAIRAEMADLQGALDLIAYKVSYYTARLADGTAASTWTHHHVDEPPNR